MNTVKRWNQQRLLVMAGLLLVMVAAGCGPAPLGISWAGLTTFGDAQNLLVAFNDRLVMIDPVEGKPIKLLNPSGEVRLDNEGKPRLWEVRAQNGPNQFFAAPIPLDADTLLVATYNQVLHTVDVPTARIENPEGSPIPGTTGHLVADLVSDGDLIFAGLSTKNVVALDREDFRVQWTFPTGHGVWSQPLLQDGVLYFASLDHYLYAVSAKTGEQLWKLDLEGAAPSAPVYYNGRLFIGSFGRKIFEVSTDGQVLNTYKTLDWIWSKPTIVDDILFVGDLVGNVYALDTTRGLAEVWAQKVASSAIRPAPVVYDNAVVVASRDQKVYWLKRADGSPIMDAEGRPLVREMQAPVFSDMLLIKPSEAVKLAEPILVVSTLAPNQLLVAYTVSEARFLWAYALQ